MKTHFKFMVALAVIIVVSACENEVINPGEGQSVRSHYNGVIKSYGPEVVLKWNEALGLAIENKMSTSAETRIYAMVSLAVHDALNNVVPKYETHALANNHVDQKEILKSISKQNISHIANAAVSQAAHDVWITLQPASTNNADNLLATCLSEIEDSDLKTKGIAIGKAVASAMLTKRQADPLLGFTTFSIGTAPGTHQSNYMPYASANPPVWPANAVYGTSLGSFTPFGIESGDQFRPDVPYAINSIEYTADHNEVKRLGCGTCAERTSEQTEIGAFWKDNTSGLMNKIARVLVVKEKLDGWETARLFALLQMAQMDANIASFEAKYYYNYWIPVTAIRAADTDGNGDTQGDVSWAPTFAPPPTPDYPSTPASAGGSSAAIFKQFFGTDNKSFAITNTFTIPGVERSFTSFSQASTENALSRVYIGSHFRNAVVTGEIQGRKIGKYVFEHNLKELY